MTDSASRSIASPLANWVYRHLYLAQISALTGTGAMTVGLALLAWGIRLYLATPRLRGLLALSMAVAAATAMVIGNTVVYVRDVLGGDMLVTIAYAASGGGSMLAALLLPRVLDRLPREP